VQPTGFRRIHIKTSYPNYKQMSYRATCPNCDFDFYGGHSHHTGHSWAVCVSCHAYFTCPTDNPWGPAPNEIITVHRLVSRGRGKKRVVDSIPTELSFHAVEVMSAPTSGPQFPVIQYPTDGLPCPDCKDGTVRFGFERDENCPWCGHMPMKFNSIIY